MTDNADNPARSADARRRRGATKARATVQRHRDEARADKLEDIQHQVAEGRLRIRKMTSREQRAASVAVRRRLAPVKSQSARRFVRGFKTGDRS